LGSISWQDRARGGWFVQLINWCAGLCWQIC
jgi:hypothetical protein